MRFLSNAFFSAKCFCLILPAKRDFSNSFFPANFSDLLYSCLLQRTGFFPREMPFSNLFFVPPPQVLYFLKENFSAMRNFFKAEKFHYVSGNISLRRTEVPRLPPGVESGVAGFSYHVGR